MKKILMALVIAIVIAFTSITQVNAANTVSFGTIGTGATATADCSVVELYTPDGAAGSGYVRLEIPDGIAVDSIASLSYTSKIINPGVGGYAPEVVLNIDADGAGGLEGTGIDWMLSSYNPATLSGDNFLSGDNWPTSAGVPDITFVNRDALTGYYYWSANDTQTGFGSFWVPWATVISGLPVHSIDGTDMVYSIDFVVGTSGNFNDLRALFSSVELNGVTYSAAPSTKECVLTGSGVEGKGLENAPGLEKPFNSNSQASEKAGKKN